MQIFSHRDEGHYEKPGDATKGKQNYHADIVCDWMILFQRVCLEKDK